MEGIVNARTADDLASALQRSSSNVQILLATVAGVIPIMLGAGACLTLSIQFLARDQERGVYKVLLAAVGVLSLASCTVLAVDLGYVTGRLDSMADAFRTDSLFIITTFFLTALSTHISRLLFVHRAFILVGRRKLFVVPLLGSAHVALFLQVGLDIYGFTQPRWDSSTSGADLGRIKMWWGALLPVRGKIQVAWAMVSLVCDLMICSMIIVSLLRLRTFLDRTKGVINRLALMITQTMLPPMVLSAIYAGVIFSGTQGPGSWFRCIASFQAVFYWFAVVWTLRTREHFLHMLDPPRAHAPVAVIPSAELRYDAPSAVERTMGECGALSCTLVHTGGPSSPRDEKRGLSDSNLNVDVKRQWTEGFFDSAEGDHVMTLDEALQGPDLLYSPYAEGETRAPRVEGSISWYDLW